MENKENLKESFNDIRNIFMNGEKDNLIVVDVTNAHEDPPESDVPSAYVTAFYKDLLESQKEIEELREITPKVKEHLEKMKMKSDTTTEELKQSGAEIVDMLEKFLSK